MSAIDGRVLLVLLVLALIPLVRAWIRAGDDLDRIRAEARQAAEWQASPYNDRTRPRHHEDQP